MSIESMKLALDALEEINKLSIGKNAICLPGEIDTGMDALRQAIAEAETLQGATIVTTGVGIGKRAEEAYEAAKKHGWVGVSDERLMEMPEFTKHTVEDSADWSEWVCPDPKSYLMKCCDCGLVHEAQFGVVRYKSETEREDCDKVDDPNLQAVFRMRRHEAWEPKDTAHRAGGLPMEQAQPVGEVLNERGDVDWISFVPTSGTPLYTTPPPRKPLTDEEIWAVAERCEDNHFAFARDIEAAHGIKENT